MKKKKILFRIGSLRGGGAERALVNLLKEIDYNKYDIDLLLNIKFGELVSEVPKEVNLFWVNSLGESQNKYLSSFRKLYNVIRLTVFDKKPSFLYRTILNKRVYDVEVAYSQDDLLKLLSSPISISKKILFIHTDIFKYGLANQTYLLLLDKVDKIVVVSKGIKAQLLKETKLEASKIEVVYNLLDQKKILELSKEVVSLDFKNDLPIFCTVGSLLPVKGIDRLLNVQKELIAQGFNFNLVIVGDGKEKESLEKLVLAFNLSEYVRFVGFQSNPFKYIKLADVFVLASHYEGFGNVLVEALILGKPIISTNFISAKEILTEENLGLVVENSLAGILEGIKHMLKENKRVFFENRIKTNFHYNNNALSQVSKLLDE